MARVRVSTTIDAEPEVVWAALADIASHSEWMADAVAIRFTSPQRQGVGTTFDCDTRVGPLSLTDHMVVTEWEDGRALGVEHVGVIRGSGVFTVSPSAGRSELHWEEELRFPWWLGHAVGARAGRLVLRPIWRGNLRRLKARIESAPG